MKSIHFIHCIFVLFNCIAMHHATIKFIAHEAVRDERT
jgi:hypothetical protein